MLAKLSSAKPGHKTPYFGGMYLAKEDREIAKGRGFFNPPPPPNRYFVYVGPPTLKGKKKKKEKTEKTSARTSEATCARYCFHCE